MGDIKVGDEFYSEFGKKVIASFNTDPRILSSIRKLEKIIENQGCDEDKLSSKKHKFLESAYWGIFFQVYLNGRDECITRLESYVDKLEQKEPSHQDSYLDRNLTFYEIVFKEDGPISL